MNTRIKRIKIKLDVPESVIRYYELHSHWENEGGATPARKEPFNLELPIQKGDLLKVVSGVTDVRDGEAFYIADVEILTDQ